MSLGFALFFQSRGVSFGDEAGIPNDSNPVLKISSARSAL